MPKELKRKVLSEEKKGSILSLLAVNCYLLSVLPISSPLHRKLLSLSSPSDVKVTKPMSDPLTFSIIQFWNLGTLAEISGAIPVPQEEELVTTAKIQTESCSHCNGPPESP